MNEINTIPLPFNPLELIDSLWKVYRRMLPRGGPYFENVSMSDGICDEASDVETFDKAVGEIWFEALTGYFAGLQETWTRYHLMTLDVKRMGVNIYDAVTINTFVYLSLRTAAKDNRKFSTMLEAVRLLPQTWLVATQWVDPMMPDSRDEVFENVREQLVVDRRQWVPTVKEIESIYRQTLTMKEMVHEMGRATVY